MVKTHQLSLVKHTSFLWCSDQVITPIVSHDLKHTTTLFIIQKTDTYNGEKLFIKNKHQNKQLQIKRALLQVLLL